MLLPFDLPQPQKKRVYGRIFFLITYSGFSASKRQRNFKKHILDNMGSKTNYGTT